MDPYLAALLVNGGGVLTVLIGVYWALVTGRLATRREVEDIMHDRDEWRTAHRISETGRVKSEDQTAELLRHFEVIERVLRALPAHDRSTE